MTYRPWLIAVALSVTACTPSLNWREVRPEHTSFKTLMPCKPDHGSKDVNLGARAVTVRMSGCQAQNHLIAVVRLPMPTQATEQEVSQALQQWQAATLANFKGQITGSAPFEIKSKSPSTTQKGWVKLSAHGVGPDAQPIQSQMVFFVHETNIVQAVVYAPQLSTEVTDTFFSGIELP